MTIKAFAQKYGVSYYLAYEASFGVRPKYPDSRDKDFSEHEMANNLLQILNHRLNKHYREMHNTQKKIMEVKSIAKHIGDGEDQAIRREES